MPRSDTWRVYGFDNEMEIDQIVKPTAVTNTTPVVWPSASTGFDTRTFERKSILVVINISRTANGVTFTITESATTNGTYAAATVGTTLAKLSADGVQMTTVKKNPAKPFIRVTATGDNASTNITAAVTILGI